MPTISLPEYDIVLQGEEGNALSKAELIRTLLVRRNRPHKTKYAAHKRVPMTHRLTFPTNEPGIWEAVEVHWTNGGDTEGDVKPTITHDVWRQRVGGQVKKVAEPEAACSDIPASVKQRKDGSALQAMCLDGVIAFVVSEDEADEGLSGSSLRLKLLDGGNGDILYHQMLPSYVTRVDHLLVDGHRVMMVFENTEARRTELELLEFYLAHPARPFQVPFVTKFIETLTPQKGGKKSAATTSVPPPELKIFNEVFSLGNVKVDAMALTQTRQRITPQALLIASEETNMLYQIQPSLLTARRPMPLTDPEAPVDLTRGSPGAPDLDTDAPPYAPTLPLQPFEFLPESGLQRLRCEPTEFESTTAVHFSSTGQPLLLTPAKSFDKIPSSKFGIESILVTLLVLAMAVLYVFRQVSVKQKRDKWM